MTHSIHGSRPPLERCEARKVGHRHGNIGGVMWFGWRLGYGLRSITDSVDGEAFRGSTRARFLVAWAYGREVLRTLGVIDGSHCVFSDGGRLARVSCDPSPVTGQSRFGKESSDSRRHGRDRRLAAPSGAECALFRWRHRMAAVVVSRWSGRVGNRCGKGPTLRCRSRSAVPPRCGEA